MNKTRIVFGIGIVLAVLTVFTASAMAGPNTMYLNKSGEMVTDISVNPDETAYVELWANITDEHGIKEMFKLGAISTNITFNSDIGDITACNPVPGHPWDKEWMKSRWGDSWFITVKYDCVAHGGPPFGLGVGHYPVANYTIEGVSPGVMDLHFSQELPRRCNMFDCEGNDYPNQSWVDATFACNKSLPVGWNLVSRPDITADNSTASVLAGVSYDAVYRYDATTKDWVNVTEGTMDPGIGYFVHVTAPSNWTFKSSPYKQMNIELEKGLNMIGWLDCSKPINQTSLDDTSKVHYIARWNTTSQEFEVYEPHAPAVFNDFWTLEPATGYFVAAKTGFTLTESC